MDTGIWLPPQRTFSSLVEGRPLEPERTEHLGVEVERDFGTLDASRCAPSASTSTISWSRCSASMCRPRPVRSSDTTSSATPATSTQPVGAPRFAQRSCRRVHGSVEYSMSRARWSGMRNERHRAHAAGALGREVASRPRSRRVHVGRDECARNVDARPRPLSAEQRRSLLAGAERPTFDSRFDVQVRQSLPFMDFSTARWEMLVAVRNFFREASADSVGLRRAARRSAAQANRRRPHAQVLRPSRSIQYYWIQSQICSRIHACSIRRKKSITLSYTSGVWLLGPHHDERRLEPAEARWLAWGRSALCPRRGRFSRRARRREHRHPRAVARGRGRRAAGTARAEGVTAVEVAPGSAGARAGIERGDVLLAVNGAPVQTPRRRRRVPAQGREPARA